MRLPRWLVASLLSVSVVFAFAAAGWWWVSWPDRTAREFVESIHSKKWDEARSMLGPNPRSGRRFDWVFFDLELDIWQWSSIDPEQRTFLDVLAARKTFLMSGDWHLYVERGRVASDFIKTWEIEDLRQ